MEGFVGSMGLVGDGASMGKEFSDKKETSVFCFLTRDVLCMEARE